MHMISKKGLNDAEMDTLTKSCSPTIVITANGEVQTHDEATVYVKELDIFLTMKVLEDTPAVLSLGKLCDEHGYSFEWINGQKPHLIKSGILIQCNTENFVPIVVPGLSTSSSSSSHLSTSMTPSRQERNRPASTSSSSPSPTTTASSDREIRDREDQSVIDSPPVPVSSSSVEEMIERRNPLFAADSRMRPKANPKSKNQIKMRITSKYGETRVIPTYRNGCKNCEKISWMTEFLNTEALTPVLLMKLLWSRLQREVRIWVSTVFILTSRKTEIARSVRGSKSRGPRAEDAVAEPYFVQKILVT